MTAHAAQPRWLLDTVAHFRPDSSEIFPESALQERIQPSDSDEKKDAFGYRKTHIAVDDMTLTLLTGSDDQQASTEMPKSAPVPPKEVAHVAYLDVSSNLSPLVQDRHGTADAAHCPFPPNTKGLRTRPTGLSNLEIDILRQRGAFLLPPKPLCDELIGAYFRWVAPMIPIINRSRFMRHYRDPENPPSLLLLQAILLAGSRSCTDPQLMDVNGSTTPAAMAFYMRAKALYDADYEDDHVTIVQALVLLGWYWEGTDGEC